MAVDPLKETLKVLGKAGIEDMMKSVRSLDAKGRAILLDGINSSLSDAKKQLLMSEIKRNVSETDASIRDWLVKSISTSYVNGMNEASLIASSQFPVKQTGTVLYKWSGGVKGETWQMFKDSAGGNDPFNFGNALHFALDPESSKDFGDKLTASVLPKKYKLIDVESLVPSKFKSNASLSPEDILARETIKSQLDKQSILTIAKHKGYDGVIYPSNINNGQWVALNPEVAKTGLIAVMPKLKPLTVEVLKSAEFSPHLNAVNALLSDAYVDFGNAMSGYVKGAEKILNSALKEQIRSSVISSRLDGASIRDTAKDIKALFQDKGFTMLSDRSGREWSIDNYSEMLARTHTIKANTEGAINRASDFSVDIIEISDHGSDCPICGPMEGRLFSISGDSKDYPKLTGNEPPFHPRCRHTVMYRPDLS